MIATDYNNVDQFADGYMEQEEEWEREGLLDPAWEKQQKKTDSRVVEKSVDMLNWQITNRNEYVLILLNLSYLMVVIDHCLSYKHIV
ncbi:hypothetical protein WA026_009393 [Henosepilachna vigintioctopunctata]|uniref:Alpha-actinin n=1 Tax=Henosepilachna vigintioctopunctata TaxID=420089 RepID=A0AAW1TZ87_9CUCU